MSGNALSQSALCLGLEHMTYAQPISKSHFWPRILREAGMRLFLVASGGVRTFQVWGGPGVVVPAARPWPKQNVIWALSLTIRPAVGSCFCSGDCMNHCVLLINSLLLELSRLGLYIWETTILMACVTAFIQAILQMAWVLRNNK